MALYNSASVEPMSVWDRRAASEGVGWYTSFHLCQSAWNGTEHQCKEFDHLLGPLSLAILTARLALTLPSESLKTPF